MITPDEVRKMIARLRTYGGVPPFVQRQAADLLEMLADLRGESK